MSHRYHNPQAKTKGFTPLGVLETGDGMELRYELYALPASTPNEITLGARYGNRESDYVSGYAYRYHNEWQIMGGLPIAVAAARFFARVYPKSVQNPPKKGPKMRADSSMGVPWGHTSRKP